MEFADTFNYPADPATVFAMITDPEFVALKAVKSGSLTSETSVQPRSDGGATVNCDRVMPANVPDFIKSFVGETIAVRQVDVWSPADSAGNHGGTTKVDVVSAPVAVNGTLALTGSGSQTAVAVKLTIKASVPFVGGKIEKAVADVIGLAIRQEEKIGHAWLAGDHTQD